ncbi:ATP synthase subunit C [Anaeromyxobacter oryzae]|uniref:V-type ATP synthase subunit K n=1 Tax=Anaeromyxobacter oryzae TaxID=2918170 RepID=A0ABM7WPR2_9BACT|nr:ATP synthase subunit C [Anaeromyxobacter oryzae]BDG01459.1 V-type ATP synthase subunit K [Anaeromyxobacter oryzae]
METHIALIGWIGIYAPVALAALGSAIGCTRAGKAACGAVLEVDGGYGRYIGLSVLPSSIIIYGIVIMFTLNRPVAPATSPGLFALGAGVGIALLVIGVLQGECCAAAINASKEKPAVFGLMVTPAAIVEGLAVFAFVFALIVSAALPKS